MTAASREKQADSEEKPPCFKTLDLPEMRALMAGTMRRIEFLRRRQDNGRKGRFTLLSEIAGDIAALDNERDLPGGYTDPEDAFACDALGIARTEFEELRRGDYPVPKSVAVMPNGKRL